MSRFGWVYTLLLAFVLHAQTPPPQVPDNISVERNIAYDQHPETVLDVYQPKELSREKRPGVIVIHGGGWVGGAKDGMVQSFVLRYLEKGFVVANVEYRLAKAAIAPAAVTDVLNATEWFFKNAGKYNVDKKRIVVTGGSAGGHLSLMVGMTPKSAKLGPRSDVAAVVNFYGITDVADQLAGPNMRKYAVTWLPDDAPSRLELASRVSPITHVRDDLPPILTIHGDADETVPYEHGTSLTRALQQAGGKAEMVPVPQGKHGFPKETLDMLYAQHIWPFLQRNGILK
jgi:acetyl esterase/lipase